MRDGPHPNTSGACAPCSSPSQAVVRPFLAALLLLAVVPLQGPRVLAPPIDRIPAGTRALAPGDPLPRIQCPPGYTARVYAQGLRAPDGLAFHPDGLLYVAEERAGQVSRIDPTGSVTPVLRGLDQPEGIAFDDAGNMYVVEDVPSGRLIKRAGNGTTNTLAANLEAPEGVAWGSDGALYVTESSLEFARTPQELRSRIARVTPAGEVTRILTDTPTIDGTHVSFNSYAGIAAGPDHRLYVTNELSGVEITHTVVLIPGVLTTTFTLSNTDSVFAVDSTAGSRTLAASGLIVPEGLRFAPGNLAALDNLAAPGALASRAFPLYVTEEDTGSGEGRLSVVGPDGRPSALCTGFLSVEDVVLDEQGRLYISEGDNDGQVIQVTPPRVALRGIDVDGPTTALIRQSVTFAAAVRPITATQPITYTWSATGHDPQTVRAGLSVTMTFTWNTPGPQQIAVTAANVEGAVAATHALTVYAPPSADFVGAPARGIAPLTVAFANRSSGEDTASQWDFGDGGSSTARNPTHTYATAGAYTVTLTVSSPGGSDTETRPAYITALEGLYLPLVVRP